MARLAGVDLPKGKRIEIALTYIYGIGKTKSKKILLEAGVDWNTIQTPHESALNSGMAAARRPTRS